MKPQLGLAMLAAGFGALAGPDAGQPLDRPPRRARHGRPRAATVYALLLAGLIVMPSYAALLVLLAVFGIVTERVRRGDQYRSRATRTAERRHR